MSLKVVYIAGAFRAETPWLIEQNVRKAEEYSLHVWQSGGVALCPHTMTRFFQSSAPDCTWVDGTLELLKRCDAMLVVPGYEKSVGTLGEIEQAKKMEIPIFLTLESCRFWLKDPW